MNDDDIRAALHADAAQAPEPPAEWQARDLHHPAPAPSAGRRTLLLASAAVALLGVAAVGFAITRGDDTERITTPADSTSPQGTTGTTATAPTSVANTFPPAGTIAENFLVVGSDANACVDSGSPWAGAADPDRVGMRSDTIMIMRIDPVAQRAAVLSFPRDLWVDVTGHGKRRINTAYVPNDYSLLAQTIYDNFGIAVDHYIQIDFCAFKRIIDAIGGVAVPFATPVVDRHVGLDITAPGCHVFTGDEALAYVRSRHLQWVDGDGALHADPTADFGRIARQQDFLRRVLAKATSAGLFDPAVARALLESLQTDVVTDAGFSIDDLLRLAGTLKAIDPAATPQYRIDSQPTTIAGNAVLRPVLDTPSMVAVLAIFRGESPIGGPATPTTDAAPAGSQPASGQTPPPSAITPPVDVRC